MRDSPETYEVFFTWFIPAIGRKLYWKHIVANTENDDDITTISNEAFVLLILENNWDCWHDIFWMIPLGVRENVIMSVLYNQSTLKLAEFILSKRRKVLRWAKDGQMKELNDSIPCLIK